MTQDPHRQTGTRTEHRGAYRDPAVPPPSRGLSFDLVGVGILVGLVLVGALAVASGQGVGEEGLGVAMMCGAVLLLVVEALDALARHGAPHAPHGDPHD